MMDAKKITVVFAIASVDVIVFIHIYFSVLAYARAWQALRVLAMNKYLCDQLTVEVARG